MILTESEFIKKYKFWNKRVVEDMISYGMPYIQRKDGKRAFNTRKTEEWFLHGHFDKLPIDEQIKIFAEAEEIEFILNEKRKEKKKKKEETEMMILFEDWEC